VRLPPQPLTHALSAQGVEAPISKLGIPPLAYRHALAEATSADDRIVVFGSFNTVADVLCEEVTFPARLTQQKPVKAHACAYLNG